MINAAITAGTVEAVNNAVAAAAAAALAPAGVTLAEGDWRRLERTGPGNAKSCGASFERSLRAGRRRAAAEQARLRARETLGLGFRSGGATGGASSTTGQTGSGSRGAKGLGLASQFDQFKERGRPRARAPGAPAARGDATFRDVVEAFAAENGVEFVPR